MASPDGHRSSGSSTAASAHSFAFQRRVLDRETGRLELAYRFGELELTETLQLPGAPFRPDAERSEAIESALDLLHWVAGVSYWKAACPATLIFRDRQPDDWQAAALTRIYRQGLAEFAFENGLDIDAFPPFPGQSGPDTAPADGPLTRRTLVPIGGGKDSLVAWERLARRGEVIDSVQIGTSELIRSIGDALPGRHWVIQRQLDPRLAELNRAGALNGHVPVTAINSAILALAALLLDYDRVAFANERSASQASRLDAQGREVNHQFSKSLEFEALFDDWLRRSVHRSLRVFSILRRDRELAICRDFASLVQWHDVFSSCNRNFHLDGPRGGRWCGRCPKCTFVFLGLAPFMRPADLRRIFGRDLLDQVDLVEAFAELLALDGVKPFECVGEAEEARAAVVALAGQDDWKDHAVIRALGPRLARLSVPSLESLCTAGGAHRIPEELQDAL
jgi:hypothetical protein